MKIEFLTIAKNVSTKYNIVSDESCEIFKYARSVYNGISGKS